MAVAFNPPVTGPKRTGRPIRMEHGRVVLHSAGPEDAVLLRRWMADPMVAQPMGRRPETHSEERLRDYVSRFDRLLDHLLVIRDAETAAPLGFATISINGPTRVATIAISIGERTRARDTQIVLSGAARAICTWVFETVGLRKLVVHVAKTNERTAGWVSERMTLEGELRDEIVLPDGTARTLLRYGMLRPEWDELKTWFEARDRVGILPVRRRDRSSARPAFKGARPPRRDDTGSDQA